MELLLRSSHIRLVNPASGEMSDIELSARYSSVRLFNPASGEMSDIELSESSSCVRLVACSSPVKSVMLALDASRSIKRLISSVVMGAPDALPRSFSIAVRRLESGISTGVRSRSSKSTLTPLSWSARMWMLMAALLRGFPFTIIASPDPNPVFATRGERSEMELPRRLSHIRLINPDNAEMSDMGL